MSSPADATVPTTRRARKSMGAAPNVRKSMENENATVDVARELANSRKARSKSIGPGGLDSLRPVAGNRRASIAAPRSILKPRMSALPELSALTPASRSFGGSRNTLRRSSPRTSKRNDSSASKIAMRTEEAQQAADREREEAERRYARRKSLANRRVSFAAEATLHTFHDIDMQDSTASTDYSTRNATEGNYQRDPQKIRNSGFNASGYPDDDDGATSVLYSDDSEPADGIVEVEDAEEDEALSSDSDDATMMTIDTEEVTGTTIASDHSVDSGGESSTLEEALRIAAERAGTQRLDDVYDETEVEENNSEEDEVIPSFGWIKKDAAKSTKEKRVSMSDAIDPSHSEEATGIDLEMDMTYNMGRIITTNGIEEFDGEAEMSMDVTKALGGILPPQSPESSPIRDVTDDTSLQDDGTMEFTTALGGIQAVTHGDTTDECAGDEEMSMEFTMAMGGVLGKEKRKSIDAVRRLTLSQKEEADSIMEMTASVGPTLSKQEQDASNNEDNDEETTGMDMTRAIGGILKSQERRSLGRDIMVEEADKPNSPDTAILKALSKQPARRRSSRIASESPSTASGHLALRGKPRSSGGQVESRQKTPSPTKQHASQTQKQPARAMRQSQSRSPQVTVSGRRRSSRLSLEKSKSPAGISAKAAAEPTLASRKELSTSKLSFQTPPSRSSSGVGVDHGGLGSPRVTALFDRRSSIGDSASKFVPSNRLVAFEDAKAMSKEVDDERAREEERERVTPRLGYATEDRNATLNLREMIDSLSPAKKPLNGRKSLHVGSARGLLGKRPAELDDEDAEENDGVKRLRGYSGSPVKSVRLEQPTKAGVTAGDDYKYSGRATTASAQHVMSSPLKVARPSTLHDDALAGKKANHTIDGADVELAQNEELNDDGDDRIHLQDFLNMISIRFMELATTKGRHTRASATLQDGNPVDGGEDMSLERCVVASACTVPMLELYQHSCRELKKYIAEGRRMVKDIETDTLEDNPPLFREYMSATPNVRASMDNQFRNVKTYARFLSKAMWYEWRMKLQKGLRAGLAKIDNDMDGDYKVLREQMDMLESILPQLTKTYQGLEEECRNLEEAEQEIADCDPADLDAARKELILLDSDIEEKKKLISELRTELQAVEATAEVLSERKDSCLADIASSEKTKEDCRGWSSSEINSLRGRVDALEKKSGWAVTGVHGATLSMAYKREIEIVFDVTSFRAKGTNSDIDLRYIADCREREPLPRTVEKDFFVQSIRDHVRALQQSTIRIPELLSTVQRAWDRATKTSGQIRRVNSRFPTRVQKTSDSSMEVVTSLLVVPLRTRVQVTLAFERQTMTRELGMEMASSVTVIYGEHFNVNKIEDFLRLKIGKDTEAMEENWGDVFGELHRRLMARGKK